MSIESFSREFYAMRAATTTGSIRWTGGGMLEFDLRVIRPHVKVTTHLLDLGCGTGDLALALLDEVKSVTLVDMVPEFLERIPDDPRITAVVATVTEFEPSGNFDLGLLFGVVTHLSPAEEEAAYRALRAAVPDGTVIVKHQCGIKGDIEIDKFSERTHSRYMARYPGIANQAERLRAHFRSVEVVPYPAQLNQWDETGHAAFICREAIPLEA